MKTKFLFSHSLRFVCLIPCAIVCHASSCAMHMHNGDKKVIVVLDDEDVTRDDENWSSYEDDVEVFWSLVIQ